VKTKYQRLLHSQYEHKFKDSLSGVQQVLTIQTCTLKTHNDTLGFLCLSEISQSQGAVFFHFNKPVIRKFITKLQQWVDRGTL